MSTSSDPSGFLTNPPSVIVKVTNTSQESMNGELGVVVQYNTDRGRYLVHMVGTQQTVALKAENLVKGNMIDQAKAQYLLLTKDPRVRQEISKYYSLVASKLPPGVKPEHVAGGVVILLLLSIYFFGFTRIIMLISLIMMIGLIIGPDVFVGGRLQFNGRVVAANFPGRCRATLEQMVPMLQGKLNDQMAAGIVIVLLLLSARSIFVPHAKPTPRTPVTNPASFVNQLSTEEVYKLGFDDATLGKDFGTSLPKLTTSSPHSSIYDDLQPIDLQATNSYAFEAPKPWYSKIGMWQMMSILNIGRMLMEMGRDATTGTFSPQLAMANLQGAEPMKLGLLGFSVYNLVKVFF